MMSEPVEEENRNFLLPKSRDFSSTTTTTTMERYSLMDLDLELDPSWPFDMSAFVSNPSSPYFLSLTSPPQNSVPLPSSEQPCSPLWAFSDGDEDKSGGNMAKSSFSDGYQFTNHLHRPRFLSWDEDKRKLLPTSFELSLMENPDESCVIKERMMQALRYFKESMEAQQVLAQVWAPVKKGDRYVLTTSGQPFVLDPQNNGLLQYRTVSLMYIFSVDGESDRDLGLPGRVFRQKLPEWTPNVQYYSSKEYQRLNHAQNYNVRGTLALPVFEPSGRSCVGVVELIMTSQKINYAREVDKVCKALEAVNLKTSEIVDHPNVQICNEGRQNSLAEILEILTAVCEIHKLPLAQTWIPCRHRSIIAHGGGVQKSCASFDGSCMGQVCMSTTDVAFYVIDAHMWGFRDACSEHHLQKGQGVAGRAFLSLGSCFSRDITNFSKTNYPLVHYARMFGLTSCFAICLRSALTGFDDYILEFFLPPSITEASEQRAFLSSLFATMKQHFRNLKVASGKELEEEERSIEIIETTTEENHDSELKCIELSPRTKFLPRSNGLLNGGRDAMQSDSLEKQFVVEIDALKNGENRDGEDGNHGALSLSDNKDMRKTSERRRGKTEKSISLEVLQQYFSGSLKDAAKSLGVCPTTMKRICRQHGISRWPSRKINKVNRSLSKIKRVIESVQGAEGAFNLTSLTTSPLPVAVGSLSWPNEPKEQHYSGSNKPSELQGGKDMGSPRNMTSVNDEHGDTKKQILESGKGSKGSKTRSSSTDESTGTPTSHLSCQGSPTNVPSPLNDLFVSSFREQGLDIRSPMDFGLQPSSEINLRAAYLIPEALVTAQLQPALSGMLIEDAGSSKDLRNLSNLAVESCRDEQLLKSSWRNPVSANQVPQQDFAPVQLKQQIRTTQDVRTVSIKVSFREAIIRFRVSLTSGINELKEEIGKRLKLEMGTFEIKYLDDDHEWVLLACDADLQECFDISKLTGGHVIRLLVHDTMSNFESSCESSGD
ncbi:Phox/Bem1p [Macleaya cordata]|uniref:Phox/Bem1p n=1 Tax=Macleaya cordata TaxID=56857 RepID=A0A200QWA4_MACCD|nr:Phox/Bem1p [Macleaya cordata]